MVKDALNVFKLQFFDKDSKFIVFCVLLTDFAFFFLLVYYFMIVILALLILWHFQLHLVFI